MGTILAGETIVQALQEELIRMWQELLEAPAIDVKDDFFELGGHSLLSIELRAQLRKKLKAPRLRVDVLETPTVASMAESIARQLQAD
jgi:hypothetical protein